MNASKADEYLTVAEIAGELKLNQQTIRMSRLAAFGNQELVEDRADRSMSRGARRAKVSSCARSRAHATSRIASATASRSMPWRHRDETCGRLNGLGVLGLQAPTLPKHRPTARRVVRRAGRSPTQPAAWVPAHHGRRAASAGRVGTRGRTPAAPAQATPRHPSLETGRNRANPTAESTRASTMPPLHIREPTFLFSIEHLGTVLIPAQPILDKALAW